MPKDKNDIVTINNVDISPLIREVVEYSKSKKSVGDLEDLISKVPMGESPDWKLISGVLCNSAGLFSKFVGSILCKGG